MWSKWSLQGPMPRRPTKESTRVKVGVFSEDQGALKQQSSKNSPDGVDDHKIIIHNKSQTPGFIIQ